ncbi:MAG: cation diffusion facilitator family transporter [Candidatus Bathyarchaeota archaeon]|nr:cation diffusion facilitator family transporter [Candidatus Bathyarchaeota archaeon]
MPEREKRVGFAAFLNLAFTVLEIVGGLWTNSLAILSDALHDFGDSVALLASWIFEREAKRSPDENRTFGYQRLSLFSALFSASILIGGSVVIILQAIPRLLNPETVNATGMVGIAVIGIVFNGAGFLLLKKGESLNEKVLSWHLLEDVLGWAGILVGGVIIYYWQFYLLDPIMTIGLTAFILYNVTKSLKEAINILLQGVPKHINLEAVKADITAIEGVIELHDIHIWSLEGETDVFTAHIVMDDETIKKPEPTMQLIKKILMQKHHIEHSTLEVETKYECSGMVCTERHPNNKKQPPENSSS